jgi:hypothetical protein
MELLDNVIVFPNTAFRFTLRGKYLKRDACTLLVSYETAAEVSSSWILTITCSSSSIAFEALLVTITQI